ncbi:unnamed protein product [Thelazia callipaeda]|uniref:Histone-lysine N-methyltransferase n=1 Tax=Thelazia callipaeda TaxID=103827 RepID=A0A0N5CL12_THECL|nr:unnamed protein product [Thelazia callipaeda]
MSWTKLMRIVLIIIGGKYVSSKLLILFLGAIKHKCFICENSDKSEIEIDVRFTSIRRDRTENYSVDDSVSTFEFNKIRKCNYSSCSLWFHEKCFLSFNEGDFLPRMHILDKHGDPCINLKDGKRWICPQHECNFCHQELLRTRAFQGKFIKCVKCVFAWHRSCVISGSQHIDRKSDRYVLCPRHNSLKRTSKRNVPYCVKCEKLFERKTQKLACTSCIRSFCYECITKKNINCTKTQSNEFVCDFCRCFDFPIIGDHVLAAYKSCFWPAKTLHADLLPQCLYTIQQLKKKLCQPGYVLVQWTEGLDIPNYDAVTCRDLVPIPKSLNCPFWKRMKTREKIYKAVEAIYSIPEVAVGRKRPLPREVRVDEKPKYVKVKTNINMRLAKARSETTELGHCNCEPINGKRCTLAHNCLNRLLMTECPKDCDVTYLERRNAVVGGTKRLLKKYVELPGNGLYGSTSEKMCTNNFLRYHNTKVDELSMEEKPTKLKGFGAFAKCDIEKNADLTEYIGHVMTKEEYFGKLQLRCSFNNLEESYFGIKLTSDFYVDARNYGSIARSFNHSCDPNCKVVAVLVDGIYRLKISTIKDIKAGEELTFDYDTEIPEGLEGMDCFCDSSNCRLKIGKKANTARKAATTKNQSPVAEKISNRRTRNEELKTMPCVRSH